MQRNVVLPIIKRKMVRNASSAHKMVSRDEPAAAAVDRRPLPKDHSFKSTRQPNGLTVVSLENNSPVSRVTLIFKAGTRYETLDNAGVVHRIRNSVGFPAGDFTGIRLNHELASAGGILECSSTRDFLSYELHAARKNLGSAMYYSLSPLTHQTFPKFDLKESRDSLAIDHNQLRENYPAYVFELLHRAAFRNSPLANSLYSPRRMHGKHSSEMCKAYADTYLVGGNAALVGVGVDHTFLTSIANEIIHVKGGSAVNTAPAKYGGGEIRKTKAGHLVVAALATEGASLQDPKTAVIQSVLGAVLGTGPHLKWNEGGSRLGKAIKGATTNPFFATTFNFAYVDSGLFGIQYFCNATDSAKVTKAAIGEFRKVSKEGITDGELKAAQAKVKFHVLSQSECGHNVVEGLAVQTMVRPGSYTTPSDVIQLIEGVKTSDVQEAAKKLLSSKLSMAALGNLTNTPYIDELA